MKKRHHYRVIPLLLFYLKKYTEFYDNFPSQNINIRLLLSVNSGVKNIPFTIVMTFSYIYSIIFIYNFDI